MSHLWFYNVCPLVFFSYFVDDIIWTKCFRSKFCCLFFSLFFFWRWGGGGLVLNEGSFVYNNTFYMISYTPNTFHWKLCYDLSKYL